MCCDSGGYVFDLFYLYFENVEDILADIGSLTNLTNSKRNRIQLTINTYFGLHFNLTQHLSLLLRLCNSIQNK